MKAFAYVNPTSEKDAVAAVTKREGTIILPMAGGQDLLARMKDYVTNTRILFGVWQVDY